MVTFFFQPVKTDNILHNLVLGTLLNHLSDTFPKSYSEKTKTQGNTEHGKLQCA